MIQKAISSPLDWDQIRMVVFDIDGTLYDQRRLRLCMAREMLRWAIRSRDIGFARILGIYRRTREQLGESLQEDFESQLLSRTAALMRCSEPKVRSIAEEWLEQRPLRHLAHYRHLNLPELFGRLHKCGKKIGDIF